jgi:hypothetical protein
MDEHEDRTFTTARTGVLLLIAAFGLQFAATAWAAVAHVS